MKKTNNGLCINNNEITTIQVSYKTTKKTKQQPAILLVNLPAGEVGGGLAAVAASASTPKRQQQDMTQTCPHLLLPLSVAAYAHKKRKGLSKETQSTVIKRARLDQQFGLFVGKKGV